MWAKVAEEMQVPWRAAEAMHWQLGEVEMARRAGVVPFSLTPVTGDPMSMHRSSPSRGHGHSQSQGSLPRDIHGLPSPRYGRGGHHSGTPLIPPPLSGGRPLAARRGSIPTPQRQPYGIPPEHTTHNIEHGGAGGYLPGPSLGLAPIQTGSFSQGRGGMLPSVAELTTGVSPYSTPAYSAGVPSASPVHSATASPGPYLPALSNYPPPPQQPEPSSAGKRRASPDYGSRETSRRRQHIGYSDPQQENSPLPPPLPLSRPPSGSGLPPQVSGPGPGGRRIIHRHDL